MPTRGIRNNNPGNIRIGVPWDGRKLPNTDGAFDQFIDPESGIRALAKLLLAYQDYHGLQTIREIISRYAPGNENNTQAYIDAVCRWTGLEPDAQLNLHNHAMMVALIIAIIKEENSGYEYPIEVVNRGVQLAGVEDPI